MNAKASATLVRPSAIRRSESDVAAADWAVFGLDEASPSGFEMGGVAALATTRGTLPFRAAGLSAGRQPLRYKTIDAITAMAEITKPIIHRLVALVSEPALPRPGLCSVMAF